MYIGPLDPASNRADFDLTIQTLDDDTGELIDLTGASIVFEFRNPLDCTTLLSATTDNSKVSITDTGTFTASFTRDDMATLCAGTLDVGCTISINGKTYQDIIGTIPIKDGVVQR